MADFKTYRYYSSGTIISGSTYNTSVTSGNIASGSVGRAHLCSGAVGVYNIGPNVAVSGTNLARAHPPIFKPRGSMQTQIHSHPKIRLTANGNTLFKNSDGSLLSIKY